MKQSKQLFVPLTADQFELPQQLLGLLPVHPHQALFVHHHIVVVELALPVDLYQPVVRVLQQLHERVALTELLLEVLGLGMAASHIRCTLYNHQQLSIMSRNSGSSRQLQQCVRCDTSESVFVKLHCQHPFCLVCLSYLYVKGRAHSGGNGDQVVCSQCDRATRLDAESVEAVKATIEGTLLPSLNMLEGSTLRD